MIDTAAPLVLAAAAAAAGYWTGRRHRRRYERPHATRVPKTMVWGASSAVRLIPPPEHGPDRLDAS